METSSAAAPCQAAGSYQVVAPFPSGPFVAAGVAVAVGAAESTAVVAVAVGAAGIAAATSNCWGGLQDIPSGLVGQVSRNHLAWESPCCCCCCCWGWGCHCCYFDHRLAGSSWAL